MKSILIFEGELLSCERLDFRNGNGYGCKTIWRVIDRDEAKEIDSVSFARQDVVDKLLESGAEQIGATCLVFGQLGVGDKVVSAKTNNAFYPLRVSVERWDVIGDHRPKGHQPAGIEQPAFNDRDVPF